jgi:DNA invertase Pin-like site-specific DNA recombinase
MMGETDRKVTASHLKRNAYLYVRQSTLRQVFENKESTKRQYELRQRAVALGWPGERIQVIDCDLGQSGASAADRQGFQQLVAEVSMGRAGIVLGLEVSRLARNCADWHRLLEICALSDTLILDEDGLYNSNDFNDRLLLGLKGTMSEAELHFLRARLRGGVPNKARRGELATPLPIGFIYDERGGVALDPDTQVRETIALFFKTYHRLGSAQATVKYFHKQKIPFPLRPRHKGELVWGELGYSRTIDLLHNPRYAGAFFYGRRKMHKRVDGGIFSEKLPRNEWFALIPHTHKGYISWNEYEDNQRRLLESAQAQGEERKKSPPREGPSLLQGLAICGICGNRMTVKYHMRNARKCPYYVCQRDGIEKGQSPCQKMMGSEIDMVIGELLLKMLTPMTLEVALAVQQEIIARAEELDRLQAKQVERARYEAKLARHRYMRVDPDNRLVADVLEGEWNRKLQVLAEAEEEYKRRRESDRMLIDEEKRTRIMALATDFPRLWKDPNTPDRERKRMIRLLLEDVTLIKKENITAHVRFKGGTTTTVTLPVPKRIWETWQTPPKVVAEIDRLLDYHTADEIAILLNKGGVRSGKKLLFNSQMIGIICKKHGLKTRYRRLREAGMFTLKETAKMLNVSINTIKSWRKHGLLKAYPYRKRNGYLFEPPGLDAPVIITGKKLSQRRRFPDVLSEHTQEVQYEV